MILLRHPVTGDTATAVTERQAQTWERRGGWQRVGADNATREQLAEAAKAIGVDVDPKAPKQKIAAAIESAGTTGQEG